MRQVFDWVIAFSHHRFSTKTSGDENWPIRRFSSEVPEWAPPQNNITTARKRCNPSTFFNFGTFSVFKLPPPEIAPILRFDHLEASPFVCLFGEMVRTAAVTWILASPYGCNELSFAFHLAGNQPASWFANYFLSWCSILSKIPWLVSLSRFEWISGLQHASLGSLHPHLLPR